MRNRPVSTARFVKLSINRALFEQEEKKLKTLLKALLVISFVIGGTTVFADETWTYLPYSSRIDDIVIQGDYVWADTNGGLLRWNKLDGSYEWFTEENGLLSNRVGALYVDSNNKLWVGTSKGIQRFDGTAFTTIISENDEYPELSFSGVVEADDGTMWFAGYPGVRSFDGTTWTTYTPENSELLFDYTRCITIDHEGVIWISYSNSPVNQDPYAVASFDGTKWTNYTKENSGLGSNDIYVICVDSNNVKWFGSMYEEKEALWSFDDTTWTSYEIEYVGDISEDSSGKLWVASGSWLRPNMWYLGMNIPQYPLISFNGETWTDHYYDDYLPNPINGFFVIDIEPDGTQWFVTGNNNYGNMSLHSFDGATLKSYYTDGPRDHNIYDVSVDNDNNLWIATHYGITKYDGNTWEQISFYDDQSLIYEGHEAQVLFDKVNFLAQDNKNLLWTTSTNGLRTYDGTSWSRFDVISDSGNIRTSYVGVQDMAVDHDNVLWFAGHFKVESYDGTEWKTYKLNEITPRTVTVDKDNVKWFGIYHPTGGVLSFDGETWTEYCEGSCSLTGAVNVIAVDRNNVKWFGTNEGVWSFDGAIWTAYDETIRLLDWPENPVIRDSQDRVVVQDIVVDENNTKWICVYNMIVSFDGISWRSYAKEGGEYYKKLAVDHDNVLWMVGRSRIERVDLAGIGKYAGPTSVDEEETLPEGLAILGNYPNPFNPSTTIEFILPETGFVDLVIYNIAGQKVRTLLSGQMIPGVHDIVWNGRDESGRAVSSGVYITHLKTRDKVTAKQMMLLR